MGPSPLDDARGLRQKTGGPAREIGLDQSEDALAGLLAAVARGDQIAFRTLYDQTSAKLLGTVLRIVRDRPMANDVLQDAYLRIWQKSSLYSSETGRPMTWLLAVARNAAIDCARKRTEPTLAYAADGSDPILEIADPDGGERDVLLQDRLGKCLSQLDGMAREAVLLAYREGYSREELAARYERAVPTVKTWLRRALLSLRACLDGP